MRSLTHVEPLLRHADGDEENLVNGGMNVKEMIQAYPGEAIQFIQRRGVKKLGSFKVKVNVNSCILAAFLSAVFVPQDEGPLHPSQHILE